MEARDRLGRFWLPSDKADSVPGLLSFDDVGVSLQLLGLFKADYRNYGMPGDIHHPVVHGNLENHSEPVAVLGCNSVFTAGFGWSLYRANAVLLGELTDPDGSLNIRDVSFELTGLEIVLPWASHALTMIQSGDETRFIAESTPRRQVTCSLGPGLNVRIDSGTAVSTGDSTSLSAYHHAHISADRPRSFHELMEAAMAVRDLVEVLTGQGQQLSEFRFDALDDSRSRSRMNLVWPALEHRIVTTEAHDSRVRSTVAISVRDIMEVVGDDPAEWPWSQALDQLAGQWIEWRSTYELTVNNLREPILRSLPTRWDRFTSHFAAAETYAKQRFGGTVDDHENAARVKAVLDALPADLPEGPWVESVLASRRGKGQKRLLQEILDYVDGDLLTRDPLFATKTTSLRGKGSHGEKSARTDHLIACTHHLRLLVLLAYLADVGCSSAVLTTLAEALAGRVAEAG